MSEHLGHIEVERLHAIALLEREVGVACGASHHIERCALACGDLLHLVELVVLDEQSHALLALVGNDFLGREGLVADGQLGHVDLAATLLNELRETVEVPGRSVVVNGCYGVGVVLHQGAHQVVGAFLHLGVGTLHGVELHGCAIAACVDRRHRATAQSDAVVVATHHYDILAHLGLLLQAVALLAVAHATGQHDHLVVSIHGVACCRLGVAHILLCG